MAIFETIRTSITKRMKTAAPQDPVAGTSVTRTAPSDLPITGDEDGSAGTFPGMNGSYWQYVTANMTVARDRAGMYKEYDEMDAELPEFSTALDIYADNATRSKDEGKPALRIVAKSARVQKILEELRTRTKLEDILWPLARDVAKYGERAEEVVVGEDMRVARLKPLPTAFIIPQYDEYGRLEKPAYAQLDRATLKKIASLQEWQVLHFANIVSRSDIVGRGVGYSIRLAFKLSRMMEQAVVVARLTRAHNRLAFTVDTDGYTAAEKQKHLDKVKRAMRKRRMIDERSGKMDTTFNPLSTEEDIFIAGGKDSNAGVKVLQGDLTLGNLNDLEMFQTKIRTGLKVPKAHLQQEGDAKTRGIVTEQDLQFARSIRRLQQVLLQQLRKLFDFELTLHGIAADGAYTVHLPVVPIVDELVRWQTEQVKQLALRMFKQSFWPSDEWLLTNLAGLSADDAAGLLKTQKSPDKFNGLYQAPKVGAVTNTTPREALEQAVLDLTPAQRTELFTSLETLGLMTDWLAEGA